MATGDRILSLCCKIDTLGRLHADARRTLWHLASRQVAHHYQRRGYPVGRGGHPDYQQDCARSARLVKLATLVYQRISVWRQQPRQFIERTCGKEEECLFANGWNPYKANGWNRYQAKQTAFPRT